MDGPAGHPLIGILDDVGDLLWHTVVSQQLPEGLSVCTVGCLFIVNEVDVEKRIPLRRLLQDDAQCCYLVSAGPVSAKAGLLVSELRINSVLHSVQ